MSVSWAGPRGAVADAFRGLLEVARTETRDCVRFPEFTSQGWWHRYTPAPLMNRSVRIVLFVVLLVAGLFSGARLKANYDAIADRSAHRMESDLTSVPGSEGEKAPATQASAVSRTSLGMWGASLVLNLIAAGLIAAHEVSQYLGARAAKALFNEEGTGIAQPDYEKAEEEWAKGNYLMAIELMREYLQKNPREQHAAIRIAEIYEKDLQNPLAAALEYEEVLKQKLPPERWGWAAIHLCNLYSGKLGKNEKAIDLMRRVVSEVGGTAAGAKARARLEQLAADGVIPPIEEEPVEAEAPPEEPGNSLPPGFAPRKR